MCTRGLDSARGRGKKGAHLSFYMSTGHPFKFLCRSADAREGGKEGVERDRERGGEMGGAGGRAKGHPCSLQQADRFTSD